MRVIVVGASGFVGRNVTEALHDAGHDVVPVRAPRLAPVAPSDLHSYSAPPTLRHELEEHFAGADSIVNAAGDPDASSRDLARLCAVNALLPGVLASIAADCSQRPRFVHVSSAVVQGRAKVLDSSVRVDPFSPYAQSKILGEDAVRRNLPVGHVIYRPSSVHDPSRRVTRTVARLAGSPLRSIAGGQTRPSPQAHITNVASAVAFLATTEREVPGTVIHPWEGLTTLSLMQLLGGRDPRVVPETYARLIVATLAQAGRLAEPLAANARRIEMMWFGQRQDQSWLSSAGWSPPVGAEGWKQLRRDVVGSHVTGEQ